MRAILLGLAVLAATAASVQAETWNSFSRSPNNVFMADSDSIAVNGDITSVRVATAPLRGEAGDYSHSVEVYEFQCASGKWRTAGVTEYGPDGAEAGTYPEEGASWEDARPRTLPDYLKQIACEGSRAQPPTWPSIQAFIDAGRP